MHVSLCVCVCVPLHICVYTMFWKPGGVRYGSGRPFDVGAGTGTQSSAGAVSTLTIEPSLQT